MDNRKVIVACYFACAAISWYLSRAFLAYLQANFYAVRNLQGFQTIREALPLVIAVLVFGILFKSVRVNLYLDDVVTELKKVTWPSRDDVVKSTIVVLVFVAVAGFLLGMFDVFWGKLIGSLLNVNPT